MANVILRQEAIDDLNAIWQANTPIIVFDKKLESLRDKILFPEKLKKANEILAKAGLPKKSSK